MPQHPQLTPMQEFAMKLIKERGALHPGTLAHRWAERDGKRAPVSSRRSFGLNSAAYKTLRSLERLGLLVFINYKQEYKPTKKK
jgi:hypothetical protein